MFLTKTKCPQKLDEIYYKVEKAFWKEKHAALREEVKVKQTVWRFMH